MERENWGGHHELLAFANYFKIKIEIYSEVNTLMTTIFPKDREHENFDNNVCRLLLQDKHYDSLFQNNKNNNNNHNNEVEKETHTFDFYFPN